MGWMGVYTCVVGLLAARMKRKAYLMIIDVIVFFKSLSLKKLYFFDFGYFRLIFYSLA